MNKRQLIAVSSCVALLIGYIFGYTLGMSFALNWGFNKAVYFFDLKGIDIGIDKAELLRGILSYQDRIDRCYPTIDTNALVFNNSGNKT